MVELVGLNAWDKLYRADLFADVRFPDGRVFEDIATTHCLVMRVGRVACVPGALVSRLRVPQIRAVQQWESGESPSQIPFVRTS